MGKPSNYFKYHEFRCLRCLPPSAIWVRWRCVCACARDPLKSCWVGPSHALRAQWGAWSSSMPVSLKDPWDPACPLEPFIKACQQEAITKHFKRHRRTGLPYTLQENLMFLQPQLLGAFSSTEVALFWNIFCPQLKFENADFTAMKENRIVLHVMTSHYFWQMMTMSRRGLI